MNAIYIEIIIGIVAFLIGILIDYLICKSKIDYLNKINSDAKTEIENLKSQNEQFKVMQNDISQKYAAMEEQNRLLKITVEDVRQSNKQLNADKDNLNNKITKIEAEKSAITENNENLKKWIENSKDELKSSFSSLSKDISENNSKFFLENANDKLNDFASKLSENLKGNNETVSGIVKPVDSELKNLQEKMIGLTQRVENLNSQNDELKKATEMLNSTLKNNSTRGKWGEQQLHKIAELSGMVEHIDYEQQQVNNDGTRPDMTIHLTGGRTIPVDSKVPMNSYMDYLNATDDKSRNKYLNEHIKALRSHIDSLSKKEYWKKAERSVDLVAMVVPYESGLSAAFSADQNIFGYAMEKNVLLLSPMTFFAFLKSVSIGWRETAISQNAKEIAELSKKLIDRFNKFFEYMDNIGKSIDNTKKAYDDAIKSYNSRLLPTFNKFNQLNSDITYEKKYLLADESDEMTKQENINGNNV